MLMKNWENGQAFITGIYIYHEAKLANRFYWSIKFCISCAIWNSISNTRNWWQQNGPRYVFWDTSSWLSEMEWMVYLFPRQDSLYSVLLKQKLKQLVCPFRWIGCFWNGGAQPKVARLFGSYLTCEKYIAVSYPILAGLVPPIIIC